MICILAGNYNEAKMWASSQNLAKNEWFFPEDIDDLKRRTSFHVLVIGTAGENIPVSYFNRIYALAQQQGKIGRS